ncbi:hypothetical protein [Brachybacterium sp. GPGPB12]|uniref:hypothetical protein n=1 Tax=Brachybacterium sp. GPGPB12 TaxID=3023517 RepID=UPI003134425C
MTITLDRPTTSTTAPRTRSAAPRLQRVGGTASRPVVTEDAVTITVSVSLPAGTGDVEAALIADERAPGRGAWSPPATAAPRSRWTAPAPSPRPAAARPVPCRPAPRAPPR